jgi:hypothetical protein
VKVAYHNIFRDLLDFDRSSSNNFIRMNLPTFEELLDMIELKCRNKIPTKYFCMSVYLATSKRKCIVVFVFRPQGIGSHLHLGYIFQECQLRRQVVLLRRPPFLLPRTASWQRVPLIPYASKSFLYHACINDKLALHKKKKNKT